jgi:hypothetical protein
MAALAMTGTDGYGLAPNPPKGGLLFAARYFLFSKDFERFGLGRRESHDSHAIHHAAVPAHPASRGQLRRHSRSLLNAGMHQRPGGHAPGQS